MEFFNTAKAVRLKSDHGKYLYADEDGETVRQDRNGSSRRAWWAVELVDRDCHVIRLRSFHGGKKNYLTATDEPFLLGTAGKRVSLAAAPARKRDEASAEWEPRAEGSGGDRVRLRSRGGKYLRANGGGAPPWRNSVTHGVPRRAKTQNWILWSVDAADPRVVELMTEEDSLAGRLLLLRSSSLSGSSTASEDPDGSDHGSPMSFGGSEFGSRRESAMELFQKASVVRLRSHHDKYLVADEDEEAVVQDRNGASRNARWTVERVGSMPAGVLRLKSCYGKYLTASNMPFLLGVTGKKVLQTLPRGGNGSGRLDSSVEWEPVRDGFQVRLRTRYGQFLRANGGLPPWRNSVTHDIPHRTATQDWVLWDVDVVEIRPTSPPRRIMAPGPVSPLGRLDSGSSEEPGSPGSSSCGGDGASPERQTSSDSFDVPMVRSEGRKIYYRVSDGTEEDLEDVEEISFVFNGNSIEQLKQKLMEETELDDIAVCSRNLLNGKLYPLRLHLPPNNTEMHVVVIVVRH